MLLIVYLLIVVTCVDGSSLRYDRSKHPYERPRRAVKLEDASPQLCYLADGSAGRCKLMYHCFKKEYQANPIILAENLCVIQNNDIAPSVGVCCPEEETALAGDLPATAPAEETNEAFLKISKAQNRGCGVSSRNTGRLIGAQPSDLWEWPWMAMVTPEGYQQHCGGTLITDRHVLTAAHCVDQLSKEALTVRLGEYDYNLNNESRTYDFKVVEMKIHWKYDPTNYHHDIALLTLDRPAVFNTYVWPVCLPPLGLEITNETAYVLGWGSVFLGGPVSNVLLEVAVPVWDHEDCVDNHVNTVFEENICAGAYEGGRDACRGDSGGPLLYQLSSGRWVLAGIVSWGVSCGEPNRPGIYTRVDKYLSWIMQNARF